MARNKEKQLGRLNRLWLQQLNEEECQRNPSRPGLGSLNTADDVKKWLPSIKKDIDYYLQQSQVTSYPQRHIEEFGQRIDALTREYRAYVRKLRQLEPGTSAVPWTDRAYSSRKHGPADHSEDGVTVEKKACLAVDEPGGSSEELGGTACGTDPPHSVSFVAIPTPVLDTDASYSDVYGYNTDQTPVIYNADPLRENIPLVFTEPRDKPAGSSTHPCNDCICKEHAFSSTHGHALEQRCTVGTKYKCQNFPLQFKNQTLSCKSIDTCESYVSRVDSQCFGTASQILGNGCNIHNIDANENTTAQHKADISPTVSEPTQDLACIPVTLNLPYSDSSSDGELG